MEWSVVVMFQQFLTVHAEGEVINPTVVKVEKLDGFGASGSPRFAVTCSCGETTIVHVPLGAWVLAPDQTGSYQCGCGFRHRFAVSVTNEEQG